jgi:hypothetical protein
MVQQRGRSGAQCPPRQGVPASCVVSLHSCGLARGAPPRTIHATRRRNSRHPAKVFRRRFGRRRHQIPAHAAAATKSLGGHRSTTAAGPTTLVPGVVPQPAPTSTHEPHIREEYGQGTETSGGGQLSTTGIERGHRDPLVLVRQREPSPRRSPSKSGSPSKACAPGGKMRRAISEGPLRPAQPATAGFIGRS